jgi:predicted O-linked N-acetylglucosamine transferase (SPINDLY family)
VGASLLTAAGFVDWIGQDREAYIEKAVAAATRLDELDVLRSSQRERLRGSRLMDPARLARGLEALYRQAWCRYLGVKSAGGNSG